MNRPISVLLLDDQANQLKSELDSNAKSNRVIIKKAITNSEEGIKFIKENHQKIDAIILDGYFYKKPNSSDTKDIQALKETVEELKKLFYKQSISIPYCVLTGYMDDIQHDSLLSDIKVFRKGRVSSEMYDYLQR